MRIRIVVPCVLALLVVAGLAFFVAPDREAEAGAASGTLKALVDRATGSGARNLRLCALNSLRKLEDSGVEAELAKIATGDDPVMAVYATTQLGKKNTSAAKSYLKDFVTDTGAPTTLRKAAMTAIALHWKTASDLKWLEDKAASDSALKGHCSWLKKNVFAK